MSEGPTEIPFAKLGVPLNLESRLGPDAPLQGRLALAKGLLPLPPEALLGVLYVLAGDPDPKVAEAARKSAIDLPQRQILPLLSMKTHPKILEFLVEFRVPDGELDERISTLRVANDRTVVRVAERANKALCEQLCRNHERLLMTPEVFVALHANPECSDHHLGSAEAFLRMQQSMPKVPEIRPFLAAAVVATAAVESEPNPKPAPVPPPTRPVPAEKPAPSPGMDLLAEIEAALRGERSPAFMKAEQEALQMFELPGTATNPSADLGGFSFDFKDEADEFSWDLTGDLSQKEGADRNEAAAGLERRIAEMAVGKKIKLAYLGNKEARSILIRDRNRVVASAVVKSGRLSDQEVASYAGNKNLDGEVIREIVANKEWMRKYPIRVALVNNPKTPVSEAVSIVSQLQKKDLMMLTRNRNVPSVVSEAAVRLYRTKYRS